MILGASLLAAGLLASAGTLVAELRRVRADEPHVKRLPPELHAAAALLGGIGSGLAWGWPWGLGIGLAHAVLGVALAVRIDR